VGFGEIGFEVGPSLIHKITLTPVAAGIGVHSGLEDEEIGARYNLFRVVGAVASVGKFDGGFDLIKQCFDWEGWIKGFTHSCIVVFDIDGRDATVCGVTVRD
jgi:hypothetical protein